MSEIIAKLGLNDSKFSAGLDSAETKFDGWIRRTKAKSADILNGKSNGGGGSKLRLLRPTDSPDSTVDIALRAQTRAAAAAARGPKVDPLPPLPEVDKKATGIIGLLRRKFSTTDIFKDAFRSFGVGLGVGGIATVVAEQFQTAAERAKSLAAHTGELYQTTLRLIGVAGGPTRELQLQGRQVKELNRDIADQRRLLASFTLLDKLRNPQMMLEQEQVLQGMIKQQGDLAAGIDITIIEENRRTEALIRQQQVAANLAASELSHGAEQQKIAIRHRAILEEIAVAKKQGALPSTIQALYKEKQAIEDQSKIVAQTQREKMEDLARAQQLNDATTAAELRDAGEVEKKQIRLNALQREYNVLKKRGASVTELEANRNQQRALRGEIAVDQRGARRDQRNGLIELGTSLETGRATNPRPRGRSERERIADRGAGYRMQADEAIRTGKSPEYVARLVGLANRDSTKAGNQARNAMKAIDQADPAVGQLMRMNKTLDVIQSNLAPKGVK